ncbi:hypothetical protein [Reyranella sp.]|uniref:hypothetical protein n=1 Tax=Reyranella sp. TaxID=1929291 RepID=UPI003D0B4365
MTTMADPMIMATLAATDALQSCTEACTGWQQEIARFVDHRLAENRHSLEALMATRDLAGLLQVQQQWGLQMAADYMNEAGRLTDLFTTLSLTGTTPAVQETAMLVA